MSQSVSTSEDGSGQGRILARLKQLDGGLDWQIEGNNNGFSFVASKEIIEFYYHVFYDRNYTAITNNLGLPQEGKLKLILSEHDARSIVDELRQFNSDICERLLDLVVKLPEESNWIPESDGAFVLYKKGKPLVPNYVLQHDFIKTFNERIGLRVDIIQGRCIIKRSQLSRVPSTKVAALLHDRLG